MEEKNSILNKAVKFTGVIIFGLCAALFFAAIFAIAVKLLWNWLMPELFGLTAITFLQAFGLILLARLLVGGFHRDHKRDSGSSKKHDHLHKFFEREFRNIPEEIRLNKKNFTKFWDEEGREIFNDFLSRTEKGKEGNKI